MSTIRTYEDILKKLKVYYSKKESGEYYRIYLIQDNYSHTLELINKTLEYATKKLGLTIPDGLEGINIEVLRGERYDRVMSIEFNSITPPTSQGFELAEGSGLWDWLKY